MRKESPNEKRRSPVSIDEAITLLGGFRQFQWLLDAAFCFMAVPRVFQVLLMYFAAHDSPWKCVANSSICLLNGVLPSINRYRCNIPRTEWEYTLPKDYSITTEFGLHCDNEWKKHLLTSILFVGWGVGAVVLGWVADNYGRKKVIYPSQLVILLAGCICSFLKNVPLIIFSRFLIGFCIPGATVQSFVLASEYVGSRHRPIAGIILFISFSVSLCILALKAYFIRQWKLLSIVCTGPYFLSLLTYAFVPESVRWLRLKRGKSELMSTFRRIAYWNKKEVPIDMKIIPPSEEWMYQKVTVYDIFKTRELARTTLITGYAWLVNGMVYYGLTLAAKDLGGSFYLNFFLLSVVGIPSNICAIYFCERVGRKKTVSISMCIASVLCIIVAFIPMESEGKIFRVLFGMIGKLCIGISFDGIYVWSLELYPTSIRSLGMGFLQVTSRIGAASAPWVADSLLTVHSSAPFVVMGAATLIASVLLILVSETKGKPTLETSEDINRDDVTLIP